MRLGFFLLLFSAPVFSADVVVTASRIPAPGERAGPEVSVLTDKNWAEQPQAELANALRNVPGVLVAGGVRGGAPSSVFIRGAGANHVLLLWEGIKLNEPVHPTRSFDLSGFSLAGADRVEVIRGPRSLLYGSDALGGVVQVFSKDGTEARETTLRAGVGRYETRRFGAETAGRVAGMRYYLATEWDQSTGFSAAGEHYGNQERDGATGGTFTGKMSARPAEDTEVAFSFRGMRSTAESDYSGGPGGDDTGSREEVLSGAARLQAKSFASESWEPSLALTVSGAGRESLKTATEAQPFEYERYFKSRRLALELQNVFYPSDTHSFTGGISWEAENGSAPGLSAGFSENSAATQGVFLTHAFGGERFFISSGARLDRFEGFGFQPAVRLSPGYHLAEWDLTISAATGTGFKAPSLYQRFSEVGNPKLRAEQSTIHEFSLEYGRTASPLTGSLSFFLMTLQDLIDYDYGFQRYRNLGRAGSRGMEASLGWKPARRWEFGGSYLYTSARDLSRDEDLLRRPRHLGRLEATFQPEDSYTLRARISAVGRRSDIDPVLTLSRIALPFYLVCHLSGSAAIGAETRVLAQLDNVLDRQYEEVAGYGTPGRSLFVGLEKRW